MSEEPQVATTKDVETAMGIAAGGALICMCSIVGALAQRELLSPIDVASWADVMAQAYGAERSPEVRDGIKESVRGFAGVLRSMATKPAGGGQTRQ